MYDQKKNGETKTKTNWENAVSQCSSETVSFHLIGDLFIFAASVGPAGKSERLWWVKFDIVFYKKF